jgi:energy-coupling factor transporter transmembrane protein EcfT
VVLKAVTAALAAVMLMFSTPYPQVFAPIQRVTPTIVGDSLLMTYRSLFILADKFGDLLRAVRLRSGITTHQPLRAARATTRALGGLLLYSLDLSQREYDIMHLRGYEGGFRVTRQRSTDPAADVAALAYAALVLAVVLAFRVFADSLAGYAWLVTLAGVADLATGFLVGRRSR